MRPRRDPGPWLALLPALAALLAWWPSSRGGFLYDDVRLVLENAALVAPAGLLDTVRSDAARPLLALGFRLTRAGWGLDPFPWHVTSIAMHALAAALAFLLLRLLSARVPGTPPRAALYGALLFAITPMAAESVGYVASRSTLQATVLTLAAVGLATTALARRSVPRFAMAMAVLVLGLASKEEAASGPLFLLLIDAFFPAGPGSARTRWKWHAAFAAPVVLGLVARRLLSGAWLPAAAVPTPLYLLTQLGAFPLYLARAAVPLDPALFRAHPTAAWPPSAAVTLGAVLTLVLLAAALFGRRYAMARFAVLWLAAGLLPSSSIVALREMVVDHRAYLGALGLHFVIGRFLAGPGRMPAAIAIAGLLVARSVQVQRVLADEVSVWEDATRRAPASAEAWVWLGNAYAARQDERAGAAFEEAARRGPDDARAWTNLATWHAGKGRWPQAEDAMRNAIRANPGDARLWNNLAQIAESRGRPQDAAAALEEAVRRPPELAETRIRLARLRLMFGDEPGAREMLTDAARLPMTPDDQAALAEVRRRLP